jgi:hypothetical protein
MANTLSYSRALPGTSFVYKKSTYRFNNPKVMALNAAKSPTAGATAALKGLKPALKGNILTVVIIGAVDLVAWQNGVLSDDGKFISDFIVEFGMDVAKAVVSTVVAGFVVGLSCMGLAFLGVTAFPVFVVVGGGIIISVAVGMFLDYVDEKTGFTVGLRNQGNEVEKTVVSKIISC